MLDELRGGDGDVSDFNVRVARIVSPLQMRLLEVEGMQIVPKAGARRPLTELHPPSLDDMLTGREVPHLIDICAAAAIAGKCSIKLLRGPGKIRMLSRPRHLAMMLSNQLTANTLSQIGYFYRRDHSSVVHAIKAINRILTEQDEHCVAMRDQMLAELPGIVLKRKMDDHHGIH